MYFWNFWGPKFFFWWSKNFQNFAQKCEKTSAQILKEIANRAVVKAVATFFV